VSFVVFDAAGVLARFVTELTSSAGPIVIIKAVRNKELLDEVGGEM
jgi:hypothetical protein